jgi:CheY-like chemotaxis protein
VGKGTGLGLSICYGIITEHGGTIRVRNVQPHGASFTIELPFQAVAQRGNASARSFTAPGREGRILLVDCDRSVLESVGAILSERHHTVATASTLVEAKALLEQQEFDVVVADMQVSESASRTGLRAWLLANRPALAERMVLMRASAPSGAANEALKSRFPIVQKPFKAGDLLAVVEAALSDIHAVPIDR